MIKINRAVFFLVALQILTLAGVSFSEEGEKSEAGEGSRLVLAAPDKMEIGFGSWDATVTGGQAPSWAYLITLRPKSEEEARTERTSWGQNAIFANAIHFFNSGSPIKKIEVPWKPSSIAEWHGADESVSLGIGVGGEHITYRHQVLGPMVKGRRKPILIENKVFDHNGSQIGEGKNVGATSLTGKFGPGAGSVVNLTTGEENSNHGGSMLFSRHDDSYVVYHDGKGSLEFHDPTGRARWSAPVGDGPIRNVVIAPGGQYVFAAAGNKEWEDIAAVVDATGTILWKIPVLLGTDAAAFSPDGRYLALVTRDANWLFETATGKILAKVPMPSVFGDEKTCPHSSKVYVSSGKPRVTVITGTIRGEKNNSQARIPGPTLESGDDVVYGYDQDGGRVLSKLPARSLILSGAGFAHETVATLSPDGGWLYYLTEKGLFARHLK